jgi:competence protein ComEC
MNIKSLIKLAKRFKWLIIVIIISVISLKLVFPKPPNQLEVNFLNVGQGDAILIKTPLNQKILIDGGPDGKVLEELGRYLSWRDRTIDLIILTHPHADHLLGLIEVLKRYQVKQVMLTEVNYENQGYQYFLNLIKGQNIPKIVISGPKLLDFGDNCLLKIIYPREDISGTSVKKLNNTSIVSQLNCLGHKFLLTGDAEIETEKKLLAENIDLHSEVLKLGHHGSKTASSLEFLQKVAPSLAIIEVGKDNQFSHPATSTLDSLNNLGINAWRTDLNGALQIMGDYRGLYYKNP